MAVSGLHCVERGQVTGAVLSDETASENSHSLSDRAMIDGNAKIRPLPDTVNWWLRRQGSNLHSQSQSLMSYQ